MKNYRKLAPGEAICQRDRFLREGLLIPYHPEWFGKPHDPVVETVEAHRLARTDGTPPGWRLADGGERSTCFLYNFAPDEGAFLMKWPEDPRLEG